MTNSQGSNNFFQIFMLNAVGGFAGTDRVGKMSLMFQ
jgi:hypothetical protein